MVSNTEILEILNEHDATLVTYDVFLMVRVGEPHTDRLIEKEDIRIFVPRIRIERIVVRARHTAWACTLS